MIKLTGGRFRGRVLPAPIPKGVRPTSARVREAVFSMLGQDLAGWSMLDLCGGSGLMALEGASRSADPVTVVDRDWGALAAIRTNVERLGLPLKIQLGDALRVAIVPHDLVYLDPPYKDPVEKWVERGAVLARAVLVVEARRRTEWPAVAGMSLVRVRHYGDTSIAIWIRPDALVGRSGPLAGSPEMDEVRDDGSMVEDEG